MVLFSLRLVGCTVDEQLIGSVVLLLEISGERPFSSRCRLGKLESLFNGAEPVPVLALPAVPFRTEPFPSPVDGKVNALLMPSTNLPPPLSVVPEQCN